MSPNSTAQWNKRKMKSITSRVFATIKPICASKLIVINKKRRGQPPKQSTKPEAASSPTASVKICRGRPKKAIANGKLARSHSERQTSEQRSNIARQKVRAVNGRFTRKRNIICGQKIVKVRQVRDADGRFARKQVSSDIPPKRGRGRRRKLHVQLIEGSF
ncbi:hypothetical protein PMAYCL1PPCAC_32780, partial [Pristionchus mayeri]